MTCDPLCSPTPLARILVLSVRWPNICDAVARQLVRAATVPQARTTGRRGRPFTSVRLPTQECRALSRTDPEKAARLLTDRLSASLRELIVEAQDLETLGLLEMAEGIWGGDGTAPRSGAERLRWLQQAAKGHQDLVRRAPERIAGYISRLKAFAAELASAASPRPSALAAPSLSSGAVHAPQPDTRMPNCVPEDPA